MVRRVSEHVPVIVLEEQMDVEGLAQSIFTVNEYTVQTAAGMNQEHYINAKFRDKLIGRIMSVLYSVFMPVFGQDPQYVDVFEQISVFAEHMAKDHIFADGNKRTTLRVALALLGMQGVTLDVEDDPVAQTNELYQWVQDVVEHRTTEQELAQFLRDHAIWLDEA